MGKIFGAHLGFSLQVDYFVKMAQRPSEYGNIEII
jgi:hypothetical protein